MPLRYNYSSPFAAFTTPTIKPITKPTGTNIPANIKLAKIADLMAGSEQLLDVKETRNSPIAGPIHNPFNVYFPIVFALLILTPLPIKSVVAFIDSKRPLAGNHAGIAMQRLLTSATTA